MKPQVTQPRSFVSLPPLAAMFLGGFTGVLAQAPDLSDKEHQVVRRAVQQAAPSVVQIETFGGLERVGGELVAEGPTTGTVIAPGGWVVSSLYAFRQQPASVLVTLPDGSRAPAEVIARDFSRELALLKVDTEVALEPIQPAASEEQAVGNWVIALGKTYSSEQVSQSAGIISAFGRAYGRAVQTDAKISPINYGGPLVTLSGEALGILAPISPGNFFEGEPTELYDSGIGFAIPTRDILERLEDWQEGNDIHPGKLGVAVADQNEFNGPVELSGATPGSPAAKAGVRSGDVIVEAMGRPIRILAELRHAIAQVDAGDTFSFCVQRNGEKLELRCELARVIPVYRRRYLGLRLAERQSDDRREIRVTRIEPDSPAATSNLESDDRIVRCNDELVTSIQDVVNVLAVAELDEAVRFEIERGGAEEVIELAVTPEVWPEKIPEDLPPVDARIEDGMAVEAIDIPLGDVANRTYALIPPLADERSLGLLLLLPEPGEFDREGFKALWERFARDQGWIVVAMQSSNPRGWSMEEAELVSRILGRMDNNYTIDHLRTVVGGMGVGGRLALLAGAAERRRVSGIMTLGTRLDRVAVRQSHAPLETMNFLLVGDSESLGQVAETFSDIGYPVNVLDGEIDSQQSTSLPIGPITQWLEGLGRL